MYVSMSEVVAYEVEEEVDEAEEDTSEEVVKEAVEHIKNGIDISDVTRYFEDSERAAL